MVASAEAHAVRVGRWVEELCCLEQVFEADPRKAEEIIVSMTLSSCLALEVELRKHSYC